MIINAYAIEEIERALYHTYIKIIGRIISYSPLSMRTFLKNFLLKYEIINIKRIILGTILGMNTREKSSLVNKLVETYLENTGFINDLLEISSLEEIQLFMRNSKYYESIREGILYFKRTNETFVLEAFLDRLYYENLVIQLNDLRPKEKDLISLYVKYVTEIYNLNILYRGIKNKIDRNLLSQFLVPNYLFLNDNKMNELLNLESVDVYISQLIQYLGTTKEMKIPLLRNPIKQKHLIWEIEKLYLNYFFKRFKIKVDDIEYLTIYRIIEVIIKKDKEIRLNIIPRVVKILHNKYKVLK
jgi:vacuolar-type H+-ATPase subunit C/Vma6